MRTLARMRDAGGRGLCFPENSPCTDPSHFTTEETAMNSRIRDRRIRSRFHFTPTFGGLDGRTLERRSLAAPAFFSTSGSLYADSEFSADGDSSSDDQSWTIDDQTS